MTNLTKLKEKAAQAYGVDYVNVEGRKYNLNVVSTGSLMLDFKSGIGGFPYGAAVEVFGANQAGKSSAILYQVLGNVQKQGKVPLLIAMEPRLVTESDRDWARLMGFEPDDALILYPDHADDAFDMMREHVFETRKDYMIDYIGVDSLGAMGNKSSARNGGKTKAYGISGALTSMLNDIMPIANKMDIGLLFLNQRRQAGTTSTGVPYYDSPGGEGLHHNMRMRIHLKRKDRFTTKINGESTVIGNVLAAEFVKNNASKQPLQTAEFDFYNYPGLGREVGIDKVTDIINVGQLTGVITGSTWLEHHTFPKLKSGENKIQGSENAGNYLIEHPEAYAVVREEVLASMIKAEAKAKAEARERAKQENKDIVIERVVGDED